MGLLTRRLEATAPPETVVDDTTPETVVDDTTPPRHRWGRGALSSATGGTEWTFGVTLATRAVHYGLLGCLVAGPLALAVTALASNPPPVQVPKVVGAPNTSGSVQAAAAAQRLLVAWLTASRTDETALLEQLLVPVGGIDLQLPATRPSAPARVWLENVKQVAPNRWAVTLGAQGGVAGASSYYTVPVQVDQSGAAPLTLPARTAAPAKASNASLDSAADLVVGQTDPVSVTVQGYLTALLAGSGDLDRWTAPGATVTAIEPAPCRSVRLQQVRSAVEELPAPSSDGAPLAVTAAATCTPRSGTTTVSQYPLLLRARGDRWEVAAPNPSMTDPSASPATTSMTTPSPSASLPR